MDAKRKMQDEKQRSKSAIQEAIEYGIDVSLLYERISLSPTDRIERHQQILEFVEELRRAGERRYGKG